MEPANDRRTTRYMLAMSSNTETPQWESPGIGGTTLGSAWVARVLAHKAVMEPAAERRDEKPISRA